MRSACAIVIAALLAQGCSTHECTLVGCVNGVDVDLRTEPGTWADGRYTASFMLRARFDELTPDTVGIRVERDGASLFEELLTLRYESWYPNGPECAPACRSSNVEVTMP